MLFSKDDKVWVYPTGGKRLKGRIIYRHTSTKQYCVEFEESWWRLFLNQYGRRMIVEEVLLSRR